MFELYRWIANFYLPPTPSLPPCPQNIVTKLSSQYGNEKFVHNWVEFTQYFVVRLSTLFWF